MVRQWVLSLPIPLRVLLAAQPGLVTPVPQVVQVVQRVIARHLMDAAGLHADEGHGGAATPIQRFGSAASVRRHRRFQPARRGWQRWCRGRGCT
jgi:hypothetical protein